MKSMVLKGLVLVSALALVNCDDTAVAPATNTGTEIANPGEGDGVSSAVVNPESGAAVGPESSTSVNPQSSTGVGPESCTIAAPESSETVNPLSSETVNPASSETVPPASSETVTPASSSSEEVKPAGVFLAEGKEEEKDQMQVEYIENIEPGYWDKDKNRFLYKILAYPKQLSTTQKHGWPIRSCK